MKDARSHRRSPLCYLVPMAIATVVAWPWSGTVAAGPTPTAAGASAPSQRAATRAPRPTSHAPAPAASPGPQAHAAQPETLTATVNKLDVDAGTVDLLTGVGHALRIRRVHLPPDARVLSGSRAMPASALTPGCIVRVECRRAASGTIASRVQLLRTPARERRP